MTEYKALSAFEQADLQKQVEELKGMVAMQADALNEIAGYSGQSTAMLHVIARNALSATAETVQAYRDKWSLRK